MNLKLLLLLAVALVLSACGGAASTSGASAPASAPAAEAPATTDSYAGGESGMLGGATSSEMPRDVANTEQGQPNQQGFARMVIKTADLSLQVADVRATEAAIRTRAETLGGYIIQSSSNGTDEDLSINLSFRVPVDRFDEALGNVQGMAEKVLSSTVRGDDVTEEFVDLDSRRKTLEATRDRLLELLSRANTVEETLQVNQTLTEIQSQIDQIEGRIKYLSQSAAMSTINVSLTPVPGPASLVSEDGWQPLAVARAALRDLLGFGQGLASILIVLLVWSPVWGLLLLVGLFVARKLRGGRAGRKAPATTAP